MKTQEIIEIFQKQGWTYEICLMTFKYTLRYETIEFNTRISMLDASTQFRYPFEIEQYTLRVESELIERILKEVKSIIKRRR